MKNKNRNRMNIKFTGIILVIACLLFSCSASFAADLRYNENDQKWRTLENQRVWWNSNYYYGNNCFAFVKYVIEDEGRGTISTYDSTYHRALASYTGGTLLSQHFKERDGYLSASTLKQKFSNAQAGDVVQMRWKYSRETQHTALINGFESDGVYFFQSNVSNGANVIKNSYYSYSDLAQRYNNATYGGFSLYRFGSDPEPDTSINPGLRGLSNNSYAKAYTLTSSRYTGVYTDSTLSRRRSSSSWTGEDDIDYITGVGRNYNGTLYARIKYPVGNSRVEAYANLNEVFVSGNINEEPKTAINSHSGLYWRKNSDYDSSLKVNAGDKVYLFTQDNGWCQIMYPDGNNWQIAWLTQSDYDKLFEEIISEQRDSTLGISYNFTNGKTGNSYSDYVLFTAPSSTLTLSRFTAGMYPARVIEGQLPPGLYLSMDDVDRWQFVSGASSIKTKVWLKGTPTQAGTYNFTLRVGTQYYVDKSLQVVITAQQTNPPNIYYNFVNGKQGVYYSDWIYATGGTRPYRLSLVDGSLPNGLSLSWSGNSIYLKGIPTRYGMFRFKLRVTDNNGQYVEKDNVITITSNSSYVRAGAGDDDDTPSKPKILTKKLPYGYVDTEFSIELEATGTKPITWTSDNLPEGFSINQEEGIISGVPYETGNYSFTVKAENSEGTASKKLKLKVKDQKPLITTESLPNAVIGVSYDFTIECEGNGTIKFSKSGKLPKGLTIDKTTGNISGVPTKTGTYSFTVKAKNKTGKCVTPFVIIVNNEKQEGNEESFTASSINYLDNSGYGETFDDEEDDDELDFEDSEFDEESESEIMNNESGCNSGLFGMMSLILCAGFILKRN